MIIRSNKIIRNKTAVCLGFFDGVHIGHQSLINEIKKFSGSGVKTLIYTFDRHACEVLGGDFKFITPYEMKISILKQYKTDYIYIQHMDSEFMSMTPGDFVKNILKDTLNAEYVVVGKNYTFGRNKAGSYDFLIKECKKYGIECHVMPYIKIKDRTISSSAIREFISNGEIKLANEYMGRKYTLSGKVIICRQDGRKMGFPTANFIPHENAVLPPNGVYATNAYVGGRKYASITNIGRAPTFGGTRKIVETNIFEFDRDIYGKIINVEFLDKIRPEIKFTSVDNLISQIKSDIAKRKEVPCE